MLQPTVAALVPIGTARSCTAVCLCLKHCPAPAFAPATACLALQEAACGSLATFLEEGEPERHMAPYMAAILQTLATTLQVGGGGMLCVCGGWGGGGGATDAVCLGHCFDSCAYLYVDKHLPVRLPLCLQRYGRKAMRNAYDTISTAAEAAPDLISQPALAQVRCWDLWLSRAWELGGAYQQSPLACWHP